jgi:TetR/AcrR family transcriptional regulator
MVKRRRMELIKEETRNLILEAAENEFARWGFHSARLSDMADIVGVTRTSVLYHFKDKPSLYQAVLEKAFTDLSDRVIEGLEAESDPAKQIEGMIETWIEYSAARPTLARLFMREVADAENGFRAEVEELVSPLFSRVIECIESGGNSGAFRKIDPTHFVTILAGATTWYATSAQLFGNRPKRGATEDERYESYRDELIRVTRFMLGPLP